MPKTIGYIRVSTEDQDLSKQKHLLLEYAQQQKFVIDEFIEVEVSSRKDQRQRRILELLSKLQVGDRLVVAELSRLGRDMLETIMMITTLGDNGVQVTCVRQPELSTSGPHGKLLLVIYSYFAEAERDFISVRTKQGLAAARASGVRLGRPKGSKNKKGRILDPFKDQIQAYLRLGVPIRSIQKLVNPQIFRPLSYHCYTYYIHSQRLITAYEKQTLKSNNSSNDFEPSTM